MIATVEANRTGNIRLALDLCKSVSVLEREPDLFLPFAFYLPVLPFEKSTGAQGVAPGAENWIVDGPLSDPGEDLEGEEMDMAGLTKGLATFFRLNAPVDWDHLWEKTREPKWLIGRGLDVSQRPHPVTQNLVPYLRAEVFANLPVAQQAMDWYRNKGSLGYSVAGGVVRKDGNRILEPIVTSVALTPVPVVSANTGTVQLVKSLRQLREGGHHALPGFPGMGEWLNSEQVRRFAVLQALKSLQASGALPHSGPGISATQVEELVGAAEDTDERKKREAVRKALQLLVAARLTIHQAALA